MSDSPKHVFNNQVVLEDGSVFYYSITPYELKNPLGYIVAVLQEYSLSEKQMKDGECACKLYKTKDGSWYDFEITKSTLENRIVRLLKSAIDAKEKNETAGN